MRRRQIHTCVTCQFNFYCRGQDYQARSIKESCKCLHMHQTYFCSDDCFLSQKSDRLFRSREKDADSHYKKK